MPVYYDIDTDVRINGSLSLPSGSITLNNGNVTATKFIGDGSQLTNLPTADLSQYLKKDGTVAMTGNLTMGNNSLVLNTGSVGLVLRNSLTDITNGAPWYGIGNATAKFGTQTGNYVQVGGYFGLKLKINGGDLDLDPNDLSAPKWNGKKIFHEGNLSTTGYVQTGAADQNVGNNFMVKGMLFVGDNGSTGDMTVSDATGARTIHIDGGSEGKINSSTVKVHIKGNGTAEFRDKVTMKSLQITDATSPIVQYLNAERLNSREEWEFDKNISNFETGGGGIHSGLRVVATTPPSANALVQAGVVYTPTGRRFEYGDTSVAQPAASTTYDRIDVIYVEGASSVNGPEGAINVIKGWADANPVPPSRAAKGENPNADTSKPKIPYDGTVLAHIRKRQNVNDITDGLSGTFNALTDKREWRTVRTNSNRDLEITGKLLTTDTISEAGMLLTQKYAQLATPNTFKGNITIDHGNSPMLEIRGTNNDDTKSPSLYLSEADTNGDYGFKIKYLTGLNALTFASKNLATENERLRIYRDEAKVEVKGDLVVEGKMVAKKNAATVTIPAGQTSAKWTHNYGAATYAISISANSPSRHVYWESKTNNTIDIKIDDPDDQDILVDVILIGY